MSEEYATDNHLFDEPITGEEADVFMPSAKKKKVIKVTVIKAGKLNHLIHPEQFER